MWPVPSLSSEGMVDVRGDDLSLRPLVRERQSTLYDNADHR
jgi:hypothetical protein